MSDGIKLNLTPSPHVEDLVATFDSLRLSALMSAAKVSKSTSNVPKDENDGNQNNLTPKSTPKIDSGKAKTSPNKPSILKSFYGEPEDEAYTSPRSPSNIRVEDLQSIALKLRQKKAEKEMAAEVRRELEERNKRFIEAARERQKQLEQANKEVEVNIQRRLIENERKLMMAIEEHEREAREFEESQKAKCEETKHRFEEMRQRSQALERFRATHELFKRVIEKFVKAYTSYDKNIQAMFTNYKSAVNQIIKRFEANFQMIDKSSLGQEEIESAQRLYKDVDKLIKDMELKVAEIKKAEEMKLKEEQERQAAAAAAAALEQKKQKEAEAAQLQQAKDAVDKSNAVTQPQSSSIQSSDAELLRQFVAPEAFERYERIMSNYKQATDSVKPLQEDDSMKKYRTACQFVVSNTINCIAATSPKHLFEQFQKLYNLLSGAVVKASVHEVSITQHPLAKIFCELLIGKKLANSVESISTTSTARAEFAYAAVTVALWQRFPEVGQFFLAYLYKECPYFVPYFIPRLKGQSDEEYYKSIGFQYKNGKAEDKTIYLKRMSATARLYAAVWITTSRNGESAPNPHGLENGWRWLCNFLNLEPQPDICATLILEALKVAGHAMQQTYGKQFLKLLFAIQRNYIPRLSQVDTGGPTARLQTFIDETIQRGRIDPPDGMLPVNFW